MVEKEIGSRTADGDMTTFVVRPDGDGPFPVAVIFMDGVGYREQLKANARRFAADGYYSVAPDLYYREGDRLTFDMSRLAIDGFKGPEAERMMKAATSVTPANVVADTRAVLAAISSDPAAASGPKVCVGYCLGARVSLHAASALADEFVAAAGIHPGALITDKPDSPHHDLASVRGELYFAFAETDRTVTAAIVDQFRRELRRNGVRAVVERLVGTTIGLALAGPPVYTRAAADHHIARTLALSGRNLTPEPVKA